MGKLTFLVLSILFMTQSVNAEYRVYQYYVKSKEVFIQDKNSYLVTSTLDPVSYVSYHGGNTSIKVDLLRTWMCKGHTGNIKSYCKSPYEQSTEDMQLSANKL